MGGQDVLIANLIGPALTSFKTGTYLDIGCGHELINSNTKIFAQMGWSGVAIDMLPLGQWNERPNCKLISSALIDKSFSNSEYVEAFIHPTDSFFSTVNPLTKERHIQSSKVEFKKCIVKTIHVETLINQTQKYLNLESNSLDLLCIDIEEGLDRNSYRKLIEQLNPKIVVVECDKNQFKEKEQGIVKSFVDLNKRMMIMEESWELTIARQFKYKLIHILGYDLIMVSPEFSPNMNVSKDSG